MASKAHSTVVMKLLLAWFIVGILLNTLGVAGIFDGWKGPCFSPGLSGLFLGIVIFYIIKIPSFETLSLLTLYVISFGAGYGIDIPGRELLKSIIPSREDSSEKRVSAFY